MRSRRAGLLLLSSYGLLQVSSIFHSTHPLAHGPAEMVVAAIVTTLVALALLGRRPPMPPVEVPTTAWGPLVVLAILWASLVLQVHWGIDVADRSPELRRFAGVSYATTLVLTSPFWLLLSPRRRPWLERWEWTPVLLTLLALGGSIKLAGIVWNPRPAIDVWAGLQEGPAALAQGLNPYSTPMASARRLGMIFGHPWENYVYPPTTLLLTWPFVSLTGDVRYLYLLADLGSALLLVRLGRRLGAGLLRRSCELAGLLVVFHSHSLAKAWLEPVLFPPLVGLVLLEIRRPAGRAQAVLAGLLLSVKQYTIFLMPLLVLHVRRLRWALLAGACAVVTSIPFLAVNPRALFDSVVRYHLTTPYRPDGMTLTALLYRNYAFMPPGWAGPAAAAAVVLAGMAWAPRRGLTGVFAWTAASCLVLFAGSKYAFPNYYQFVMWLLLLSGLLALAEPWPLTPAASFEGSSEDGLGKKSPPQAPRRRRRR
jgi:hypothetical protein